MTMPTDNPPPIETVPEDWLAKVLNVPQKKLRAVRPASVIEGTKPVLWALADAVALATHYGVVLPLPEKSAPDDGVETLTVASIARGSDGRHFPNKNVIHARRGNGEVVVVRVVDSAKYRPTLRIGGEPMTLKAKKSDGNWWVLVGREPRYPAQW